MPPQTRTRCFKCGKTDHQTSECTVVGRLCFKCHEPGHEAAACRVGVKCGGCGQSGHQSSECTCRASWKCSNCAQLGHGHWECTKPRGYSNFKCPRCEERGHLAKECSNREKWNCLNCASTGHLNFECPKPRGYSQMVCKRCSEVGHMGSECRNKQKWVCKNCEELGHGHWECPKPRGFLNRFCDECKGVGHSAHQCPNCICFRCKGRGHHARQCSEPLSFSIICYRCGAPNHKDRTCPTPSEHIPDFLRAGIPTSSTQSPKLDRPMEETVNVSRARTLNTIAANYYKHRSYSLAISTFGRAIDLDNSIASYFTNRAIAYAQLEEIPQALADFQKASTLATYLPTAKTLVHLARCRFRAGSSSTALDALRQALLVEPAHSEAQVLKTELLTLAGHVNRYRIAKERGHWTAAKGSYEECLRIYAQQRVNDPVHIRCWGVEILIAEGQLDEALRTVRMILSEDSKATEAMYLQVLIVFLTGNLDEAREQAQNIVKWDPDHSRSKLLFARVKQVHLLKAEGIAAFGVSEWNSALQKWNEALELVGEKEEEAGGGSLRATLLLNAGIAYTKINDFTAALKTLDASLHLHKDYFKALHARAKALAGMGLHESAVEDFTAALKNLGTSVKYAALRQTIENERAVSENASSDAQDHYIVLGLPRTCTKNDIRNAYDKASLKHDPNKGGIAEMFKRVKEAYEVLYDDDKRRSYDNEHPPTSH